MSNCGSGQLIEDKFSLSGFYRGLVVDNVDSSQFGRIKVRVYGVFGSNIPAANLPWAVSASSLFAGAGSGFGCFAVPEINSEVFVFFEAGDIYQPVYFAEASSGVNGLPSERTTNYPFRKILKTKNGIVILVDDSAKEVQVNHPLGSSIKIDTNGKITITGGDITVTGEDIVIEGTTVNINP
jgi:hypothetical protein